jgi:C-terminal processing protease CtpA/Prc
MNARSGLALAAAVAAVLSTAAQATLPPLSKIDRQRGLEMLKQVYADIDRNYYDPSFKGVDLAGKYKATSEIIANATNLNQLFAALTDFVTSLDDSHTTFLPPGRRARIDYGWRMAMVGDTPLIVSVTKDSDAAAKGIEPGDEVTALNRYQPDRHNLWQLQLLYNVVKPQRQQHLVVRKPDGRVLTVDVDSKVIAQGDLDFEDVFREISAMEQAAKQRTETVGNSVMVWKMPVFGDPGPVEDVIRKARKYPVLVADLRGNGGGALVTLNTMVSWVFDREVVIATEKGRGKEDTVHVKPKKEPFTGRLIVLVDSETGSAAEMFARIVQIEKRGVVLGDRTAGAVMTSRIFRHASGIAEMVFYATMVTVSDVRMSDGASLEKVGVVPDETALPAPADLLAHRDPILARALTSAGAPTTAEEAGKLFRR